MKLNKFQEFELSDVTKLGGDRVILIDDTHYIGSFLSSGKISLVSLDGLRYNIIDGINMNSSTVNAEIHRIPTGVIQGDSNQFRPRAFRFHDILIYENYGLESSIKIFIGDSVVAELSEISNQDRLILITRSDLDPSRYHELSRAPHKWDLSYLTQSRLCEFDTLSNGDIKFGKVPNNHSENTLPDAFQILPPFEKVKYNRDYVYDDGELKEVITYRKFDQPIIPAYTDKFI